MNDFLSTGLKPEILKAIEAIGFVEPTPIQAAAIPTLIQSQQDLIGFAATGTGKTAAFSLPIIHNVEASKWEVQAIILCPTRELCLQITNDIKDFTQFLPNINTVAVYGGESIDKQIRLLKKGAHIVVGTPGRVCDMLRRKLLKIDEVRWVVLDEADEMLSMGFQEEMEFILEYTPEERQTVMFSATMPREIEQIAKTFMNDPVRVSVQKDNTTAANVSHEYYVVKAKDKYTALRRIADMNPNIYAIVFCRTREDTKQIAAKLIEDGYNADALHGDLSQGQRDLVMHRFRTKHLQILIATDVAARGIDVDNLTHVINIELPENVESYIHRSGRTGRAGKIGTSISILHIKEVNKISFYERKMSKKFERKRVPTGQEICEKQLFSLIDRVENVESEASQIEPYMEKIYKKLSDMTKEEIIKNFVALEFNQLLDHYKDAEDVNLGDKDNRDRGERGERGEKREREHKPRFREEEEEGGRGERKERSKGRPEGGFVRMFINVGKVQKVNPGRIIELLNSVKELRGANIGKIFIEENYSSFDVEAGFDDVLLAQFRPKQVGGVHVYVSHQEPANAIKSVRNKDDKKREFKSKEFGGAKEFGAKDFKTKGPKKEYKPKEFAVTGEPESKKKKKKW